MFKNKKLYQILILLIAISLLAGLVFLIFTDNNHNESYKNRRTERI